MGFTRELRQKIIQVRLREMKIILFLTDLVSVITLFTRYCTHHNRVSNARMGHNYFSVYVKWRYDTFFSQIQSFHTLMVQWLVKRNHHTKEHVSDCIHMWRNLKYWIESLLLASKHLFSSRALSKMSTAIRNMGRNDRDEICNPQWNVGDYF